MGTMRPTVRWGAAVALLAGCAVGCTAQAPNASPSASTTATASGPSSGETAVPTATAPPTGDATDDDRFLYRCSIVTGAPDISSYGLNLIWADGNYTRISSCTVTYVGPEPFVPTDAEAQAVATAGGPRDASGQLDTLTGLLRLCTRISDEAGPDGFAAQTPAQLQAARDLCPDAPQAKIMAAWAAGERFGDGTHTVGKDAAAGTYSPVVAPGEACRFSLGSANGAVLASGGPTEALAGVALTSGTVFTSDKCGIWWKMF